MTRTMTNTSRTDSGSGLNRLSSNLMTMKFMKRTKNKLTKEKAGVREANLRSKFIDNVQSGSGTVDAVQGVQQQGPAFVYEPRYDVMQRLAFGRFSFNGFNPDVERLMAFHASEQLDTVSGGESTSWTADDETDVTDDQMAERLHAARVGNQQSNSSTSSSLDSTIARKFAQHAKRASENAGSGAPKTKAFRKPID